jgi:hypothetical protein
VIKELKASKGFKELLVLKVSQVVKVIKESKAFKGFKELRVLKV